MKSVIRTEMLSKRFGKVEALKQVSLDVPPAVVWALLGRNGAGKTTLIKVLLGLLDPDSGRAEVLGHDCQRDYLTIRSKVGYYPEQPSLYEWMRVEEIGQFCGAFYPAGFYSNFLQLIKSFEINPQAKIRHLSKGVRAMVQLALAMSHDPEVLILDEPTSGLDAIVRRRFLECMIEVAASGRTVFLSSHQVPEVERVAEIVGFLKEGQLILVEKVDTLKLEVRRWVVRLRDGDSVRPFMERLPSMPGKILSLERENLQFELVLRTSQQERVAEFLRAGETVSCESYPCSLEEIFTVFMEPNLDIIPHQELRIG